MDAASSELMAFNSSSISSIWKDDAADPGGGVDKYDSQYPIGFDVAPLELVDDECDLLFPEASSASFAFLLGESGEGMDEKSVTDGDGLDQPNKVANGDTALGDLGNGLLSCGDAANLADSGDPGCCCC